MEFRVKTFIYPLTSPKVENDGVRRTNTFSLDYLKEDYDTKINKFIKDSGIEVYDTETTVFTPLRHNNGGYDKTMLITRVWYLWK